MKNPKDFPKALWAVTIAEIITFTLCGSLMYYFVGNEYMTAPAYGSLKPLYKKIAFSFAIPTIVYLGALYSVRSSQGSIHMASRYLSTLISRSPSPHDSSSSESTPKPPFIAHPTLSQVGLYGLVFWPSLGCWPSSLPKSFPSSLTC